MPTNEYLSTESESEHKLKKLDLSISRELVDDVSFAKKNDKKGKRNMNDKKGKKKYERIKHAGVSISSSDEVILNDDDVGRERKKSVKKGKGNGYLKTSDKEKKVKSARGRKLSARGKKLSARGKKIKLGKKKVTDETFSSVDSLEESLSDEINLAHNLSMSDDVKTFKKMDVDKPLVFKGKKSARGRKLSARGKKDKKIGRLDGEDGIYKGSKIKSSRGKKGKKLNLKKKAKYPSDKYKLSHSGEYTLSNSDDECSLSDSDVQYSLSSSGSFEMGDSTLNPKTQSKQKINISTSDDDVHTTKKLSTKKKKKVKSARGRKLSARGKKDKKIGRLDGEDGIYKGSKIKSSRGKKGKKLNLKKKAKYPSDKYKLSHSGEYTLSDSGDYDLSDSEISNTWSISSS